MNITRTASREEWLAERLDVLAEEQAATGRLAALAEQRRALPTVATNGADGQGVSVIVRDGGKLFHTYSAYGVGTDVILSTYRFLDLIPLGRQRSITEWPWHDTYGAPDRHEHHH